MNDSYVLAVGATNVDIKAYPLTELLPGTSTKGIVRNNPGGVARNIAENLARLGQAVTLLSAIGNDGPGRRITMRLQELDIDLSHLIISNEHRTSSYMALHDPQRSLLYSVDDTDVLVTITPQMIYRRRSLVRDAAMIFVDSNLSEETLATLMNLAQRYQVPVVADPTSKVLSDKLTPYLSQLYMITPNAAEAEVLSGDTIETRQDAMAAAHHLVGAGVKIAIITLGENGVVYATGDTSGHVPALTTRIVDLTGAADAMTATIIFGLLHDISIDEAVRLGASAAAWTIQSQDSVVATLNLDKLYEL